MVNDLNLKTTLSIGRLESLIIEHPSSPENRNGLLMLVTDLDEAGIYLQRKLVEMGYIVANLPTFALAMQYFNKAYVDGVIVNAHKTVPSKTEIINNPDSYHQGTGEIYTFLTQLRSIDPKLGVLLVTTSGDPDEYHIPVINDLIQLGVIVTRGKDERFRPFAADELSGQQFSSSLAASLDDRAAHFTERVSKISSSLPKPPFDEPLPLDIGEAIAKVYSRQSMGGNAFVTDSITVGGAFSPINPVQQYSPSVRAFHIKRVSREEALNFSETYRALIKRFRELGKSKPKTPAPLGYHVTADGQAFSVRSFIVGSSYSEISRIINPNSSHNMAQEHDGFSSSLWNEMLNLALVKKIPEWHEITHPIVLGETQKRAREIIVTRQASQLLILPEHLPEISGRSLDIQQITEYRSAVSDLYKNFPISDSCMVLPMSSKGQNLAIETFQSVPTLELLRKRYSATDGSINSEKLEKDFAFWDYNIFGRVGTVFSDIYSLVNDPRVNIPQTERPKWIITALEQIFSEDQLISLYDELFRQGIHHSMLKAQQTAIHAQVNEYRFVVGRVRDPESYVKERESLQADFRYFLGEALKHVTLYCAAKVDDWQGKKLPPPDIAGLMARHYSFPNNWMTCPPTNGKSRSLAYLKKMHATIAQVYTEPELSRFDTEWLRKNALNGNFLNY